jgi:hypothetical protein
LIDSIGLWKTILAIYFQGPYFIFLSRRKSSVCRWIRYHSLEFIWIWPSRCYSWRSIWSSRTVCACAHKCKRTCASRMPCIGRKVKIELTSHGTIQMQTSLLSSERLISPTELLVTVSFFYLHIINNTAFNRSSAMKNDHRVLSVFESSSWLKYRRRDHAIHQNETYAQSITLTERHSIHFLTQNTVEI